MELRQLICLINIFPLCKIEICSKEEWSKECNTLTQIWRTGDLLHVPQFERYHDQYSVTCVPLLCRQDHVNFCINFEKFLNARAGALSRLRKPPPLESRLFTLTGCPGTGKSSCVLAFTVQKFLLGKFVLYQYLGVDQSIHTLYFHGGNGTVYEVLTADGARCVELHTFFNFLTFFKQQPNPNIFGTTSITTSTAASTATTSTANKRKGTKTRKALSPTSSVAQLDFVVVDGLTETVLKNNLASFQVTHDQWPLLRFALLGTSLITSKKLTRHQWSSWNLEEYEHAVKYPAIQDVFLDALKRDAERIKCKLQLPGKRKHKRNSDELSAELNDELNDELLQLVKWKHHFAGASARHFFAMTVEEVKEEIIGALEAVSGSSICEILQVNKVRADLRVR